MKNIRLLIIIISWSIILGSTAYAAAIKGLEEGADVSYCKQIDFVGAGSTLTNSGLNCTLTTTSGGGVVTLEVDGVEITSSTFTMDLSGTFFNVTEAPADDLDIEIKDIYVLNTGDTISGVLDVTGAVSAASFTADPSATPSVTFVDSDTTDTDVGAQIFSNCTDTGSGTEDCDLTIQQQVAGVLTSYITSDADGVVTVRGTMTAEGVQVTGTLEIPYSTALPGSCTSGNIFQDTNATSGQQLYACESGSWVLQGGSGGSSTGYMFLDVQTAKISGDFIVDGTMAIDAGEGAWRLLADATTHEYALWQFRLPTTYSSAPVAKILYAMTSATTGDIDLEIDIMAVADGEAVNTISFDTINEIAAGTDVPGTAGLLDSISLTLTNNDSMAAGELIFLRLGRDTDDSDDVATGDAEILGITLEWTE